jgi:CubicO group peptidase (beta-lactamase class C family)
MVHSTFENPLPERLWDRAASGHGSEGKVVEGKWVVYPEMAAAGLWTTASDLARWIIGIQRGYAGVDHPVLSAAMVHEMLTVQNGGPFGLGARLRGQGDSLYFLHNGTDEGFQAYVVGSVRGGNGAVVMTNSDQPGLIPEIVSAIASEYGWVGYLPPERDIVALDRKAMQKYVGSYQGAGGFQIAIEADQLFVLRPGDKQLLLMQRNGRMISVMGVEYSFELGPGGLVKGVILYSNEAETGRATRVPN